MAGLRLSSAADTHRPDRFQGVDVEGTHGISILPGVVEQLFGRYEHGLSVILPWVDTHVDLPDVDG